MDLVIVLALLFSLTNENNQIAATPHSDGSGQDSLIYGYYSTSCPLAEKIVRSAVGEMTATNPAAPAQLLTIAFHDCYVEGCDASNLLDSDGKNESEKDVPPNKNIKGYEHIDVIKSRVEEACPGIVSCSDIIALAARDAILLDQGHYYGVFTGRTDSKISFPQSAAEDLPGSNFNLAKALNSFGAKGFNANETMALLEVYYPNLLKGKDILVVNQQLRGPETSKYFASAMQKLTHLLQGSIEGEVRLDCRKVN